MYKKNKHISRFNVDTNRRVAAKGALHLSGFLVSLLPILPRKKASFHREKHNKWGSIYYVQLSISALQHEKKASFHRENTIGVVGSVFHVLLNSTKS